MNHEELEFELMVATGWAADVRAQSSGLADPEQWLIDALGGGTTSSSGIQINSYRALTLPAVWASVQLISRHLAMLPVTKQERTPTGMREVVGDKVARVIGQTPNDLQTGYTFRETMMVHALLDGNGRAVITQRDGNGAASELLIMFPQATWSMMLDGEKWHVFTLDPRYYTGPMPDRSRPPGGGVYTIHDRDVLHIPGLGQSGLWGYSLATVAKDAFGIDAAGMDATGNAFRNGGQPGLLIEAPAGMFGNPKDASEWIRAFNNAHQGTSQKGRTGLIRENMKAHVLPRNSEDFTDLRNFSREEMLLLLGTHEILRGSQAVYKDIQQKMSAYAINTLAPWAHKWEAECNRKLLSQAEKRSGRFTFKFDLSGLVQGDPNTLADYTQKLKTQEAISTNEIRRLHGMNEVPGGDDVIPPAPEPMPAPSPQQTEPEPMALRHFANLIDNESQQLVIAARNGGNFVAWMDKYYERHLDKLIDCCQACNIPAYKAHAYVDRSKSLVLNAAGVSSPDTLPQTIENLVDDWSERTPEFFHV